MLNNNNLIVSTTIAMLWMAIAACAGGSHNQHPAVHRIENLTWKDAEVQECLAAFSEQKRAFIATLNEQKKKGHLFKIQRNIKLRYTADGGCVIAPAAEPVPWIAAKKQPLSSMGMLSCYNNLDEAKQVSKRTGKPILLLSTELPGCSACTGHGRNQLSHPFIIDAAMEFVPVLVAGGWPFIIVKNAEGKNISEKMTHQTSVPQMLSIMSKGLVAAGRTVPKWMQLVTYEWNVSNTATATFGMGCFWSGERKLGKIDGVISSRVGGLKGEVVEVIYDRDAVAYEDLLKTARSMKCASVVVARTDEQQAIAAKHVDPTKIFRMDAPIKLAGTQGQKHGLGKPGCAIRITPMTELQAIRLNSFGQKDLSYLSPSQRVMLAELKALSEAGADLTGLKPDRSKNGLVSYASLVRRKISSLNPPDRSAANAGRAQ